MLREGDLAVTQIDGRLRPIRWIGRRAVDCRKHPMPEQVWPVRITAGAFGPATPFRDLYLSPDYAVFADGVPIPVKYLMNGRTIAQCPTDRIVYYHIELPRHDVVLAEGLPAESFLDTGSRTSFANGRGPTRLFADFATRVWEAEGCARMVVTGPRLNAVRARLNTPLLGGADVAPVVKSRSALSRRLRGRVLQRSNRSVSRCRDRQ